MKQIFKQAVVTVLTWEAKMVLRRHKPFIIAVGGSVGKTSTKDAIFGVLKNYRTVRKSEKSFNSEIGVPLSVLGLPNAWGNPFLWLKNFFDGFMMVLFPHAYPEVLVLECGVDRPGDMAALATWLKPDIIVMTRLPDVPVHVEYFASPEAVAAEKLELLKALKPDGIFIYNHDDMLLQEVTKDVRQSSVGFSRYLPSHFTASTDSVIYHDDQPVGSSFTVTHLHDTAVVKVMGSVGVQNAYIYTAAAAVADQFNIPLSAVSNALVDYTSPSGRMRMIPGIKGTLIIDDTYNSSPIAAESALQSLAELRGAKRKIAVLGDMLELGQYSSRAHEQVGEVAAKCVDVLVTVGIRSRKTAEAALEHGLDESMIFQYEDAARAGRELQNFIKPGDFILVKGSQGVRAERVVEELMAEPERAGELLVRQDPSWKIR